MTPKCVGCGRDLAPGLSACAECQTSAIGGGGAGEDVMFLAGQPYRQPGVCCCCLAPTSRLEEVKVAVSFGPGYKRVVRCPVPFCGPCCWRMMSAWAMDFAPALLAAWGLGVFLDKTLHAPTFLSVVAVLAVIVGGAYATDRYLLVWVPWLRLPGHVKGCMAYDTRGRGPSQDSAKVRLYNRAFARMWRELNGAPPASQNTGVS